MAHITTLPSEVLAHIFKLGTASPENDFGQENFPALVSLVCKSWHTLALDTPTLWTTLTLDDTESPPFTKTKTHIARSKAAPLNIYLDFSTRAEPELVEAVMRVLLPELARWRHLVLVVPEFDVMYAAVRMLADAFGSRRAAGGGAGAAYLEVLRLYGPPEFDPTEPEPRGLPRPIPLFGNRDADTNSSTNTNDTGDEDEWEYNPTPRLRDVVLCGVPIDWASFRPTTLERLQLSLHSGSRRPTFADFARLTTGSPDLHTLILNASGPALPTAADSHGAKTTLGKLESLTLDCFDPEYLEGLLERVCTPALEALALADAAGDSSRVFEMLAIGRERNADAIGRSVSGLHSNPSISTGSSASINSISSSTSSSSKTVFPRLTTLKISSVECTPQAFRQLVRGLPNLTSVKLDARDADPAVLGMMAEGEGDGEVQDEEEPDEGVQPAHDDPIPNDSPDPTHTQDPRHERICPQLRTITCTGVPGTVIRDFVARRLKAHVPVHTVRICAAPEDPDDEDNRAWRDDTSASANGHWLSAGDRAWLEKHVELEFFDEDEDEEIDGGAWWSTWD